MGTGILIPIEGVDGGGGNSPAATGFAAGTDGGFEVVPLVGFSALSLACCVKERGSRFEMLPKA